jgi:hypothetical protein
MWPPSFGLKEGGLMCGKFDFSQKVFYEIADESSWHAS